MHSKPRLRIFGGKELSKEAVYYVGRECKSEAITLIKHQTINAAAHSDICCCSMDAATRGFGTNGKAQFLCDRIGSER